MERRQFIAGIPALAAINSIQSVPQQIDSKNDFDRFSGYLNQIQKPVFEAWAERRLVASLDRAEFPRKPRNQFAALEAIARNFYSICQVDRKGLFLQPEIISALESSIMPGHADSFNWDKGEQPLVDAAILAAGFLQNPFLFENKLNANIQAGLIEGWRKCLSIKPFENNWLLFAAMVEAAIQKWDKPFKPECIPHAIQKFEDWYKGDGFYSDGPRFHMDFYNSIIIHPFLIVLGKLGHVDPQLMQKHLDRSKRHAIVLERMIGPDGGFPPLGRSLCYRAGLFHHLAFMALEEKLPALLSPNSVKKALSLSIEKTLAISAKGKLGENAVDQSTGLLRPGLFNFDPQLAEIYISTASLYLCTWAFIPLGLGKDHEFWANEKGHTTAEKLKSSQVLEIDQALKD